jgi:hypothetical protein
LNRRLLAPQKSHESVRFDQAWVATAPALPPVQFRLTLAPIRLPLVIASIKLVLTPSNSANATTNCSANKLFSRQVVQQIYCKLFALTKTLRE